MSFHEPSELHSLLSGNDATTLLEIIHKCLSCETEDDFTALFPKIQELIPFDFATTALGYRDDNNSIVAVYHVNVSFSEEWFSEYMLKNYLQTSAVIRENFTSFELQYWTEAWKKLRQPEEIISLCLEFDMKEGYTFGSKPLAREKNGSLFCFSGPSMENDRRTGAILELVIPHLHLALTHIYGKKRQDSESVVLSAREKEILDWLKRGKSSWEISVILGISERTVNFHVNNVMRKLDTSKRQQAIAVAARLGLIDID